ncbi:MAG: YebC/PmpR family DNA-binding transcriptional regulator [Bacteroidia bacterium]|nr:YebC/PmpR family DNA-binding transcriptional regulator [Bacteroidia bacterium]MDW8159757.1 YebC/PmpR family DNA-binding transcriptional regulator [Bacteroidia bacterium]
MSGHSKWSTIKRKKAANDSKRSQMFTKLIREIQVAAKVGGPNIDANPRLRLAVNVAKKHSVPRDRIEAAIHKSSSTDAENFVEKIYEGYGPGGVAIMVECTTDNTNRTVANMRNYFNKHGGSLGSNGSVSYMFSRKAIFGFPKPAMDEDELALELIDAGAEDIETDEENYVTVTAPFENFGSVNSALERLKIEPEETNISYIPQTTVTLDWETAQKVLRLVEAIEDDDDTQKVFHNLELTEEIMAHL